MLHLCSCCEGMGLAYDKDCCYYSGLSAIEHAENNTKRADFHRWSSQLSRHTVRVAT